ncbi:MAG TPA: LmbE family protein, partial [Sphingobacteriaceae bacterium]
AGHGHHTASAMLAIEAFTAAADPKYFPEQLTFAGTWQAKRVLWNTFNFGGNNTTSEDQLKIDVGLYNPLLGKSYGEIAAESRSQHRSQGFGSARQRGQALEYFALLAGVPAKADLLEGVDISWKRFAEGKKIGEMTAKAERSFDISQPSGSVPALIDILTELEKVKDKNLVEHKIGETKDLIAFTAGIWLEATSGVPQVAVNEPFTIKAQLIKNSDVPLSISTVEADQKGSKWIIPEKGELLTETFTITAGTVSQPYWLKEKHPKGYYVVGDQKLIGHPENPDPVSYHFRLMINDKEIIYKRPVVYKYTNPARGELYQPLSVAPPVTLSSTEKTLFFTGDSPKSVRIKITTNTDSVTGTVGIKDGETKTFSLKKKGSSTYVTLTARAPAGMNQLDTGIVYAEINGKRYSLDENTISYEHIPVQTHFPPAQFNQTKIDLATNGKRIGYIAGAGDRIPEALRLIGYDVDMLTENYIQRGDLSVYDAIIAGVRLYNANPRIKNLQDNLMEYVQNGGTYLVQYNTTGGLQLTEPGPYPFEISRDRVTDETAEVTFLEPQHPVLNHPNKITTDDFKDWVQERGLYFVSKADNNYTPVLSMNDPGEEPNNGALIVTDYGKGRFVYTSLAFFRQLPAGVPGAYRLFVNLIAKNKSHTQHETSAGDQ